MLRVSVCVCIKGTHAVQYWLAKVQHIAHFPSTPTFPYPITLIPCCCCCCHCLPVYMRSPQWDNGWMSFFTIQFYSGHYNSQHSYSTLPSGPIVDRSKSMDRLCGASMYVGACFFPICKNTHTHTHTHTQFNWFYIVRSSGPGLWAKKVCRKKDLWPLARWPRGSRAAWQTRATIQFYQTLFPGSTERKMLPFDGINNGKV